MSIKIVYCEVVEYKSQLELAFSTSRGPVKPKRNYVILAVAEYNGRFIVGTGESVPRGFHLTLDYPELVWPFLRQCATLIRGLELSTTTIDDCITSIRTKLTELTVVGQNLVNESHVSQPFRGSLVGIETALLDLASRAFAMTLGSFLGGYREDIEVSAITTPASTDFQSYRDRLIRYGQRYPGWRVKGDSRLDTNLDYLRNLSGLNSRYGWNRYIWLDLNEALSPEQTYEFAEELLRENDRGNIRGKIILEQPVARNEYECLTNLQRVVDAETRDDLNILIMADESLITLQDWYTLAELGGCRAINIKIAKAGGLLVGRDISEEALAFDPNTEIYLGGMLASSDLSAYAILSLARGLRRVDYVTSGPGSNIRLAQNPLRFNSSHTSWLAPQIEFGIGSLPDFDRLQKSLICVESFGEIALSEWVGQSGLETFVKFQKRKDPLAVSQPILSPKDLQPLPHTAQALSFRNDFLKDVLEPISDATLLIDMTSERCLFQDEHGNCSMNDGDLVVKIQDALNRNIQFLTPTVAQSPILQVEPIPSIVNPGGDTLVQLQSPKPVLPYEGEFYICLSMTTGDNLRSGVLGQGSKKDLRLIANADWHNGRNDISQEPGKLTLSIGEAKDGLGPEGQPASGYLMENQPNIVELIMGRGKYQAKFYMNGIEVDHFTLTGPLSGKHFHLFSPPGAKKSGRLAIHALIGLPRLPSSEERSRLLSWARNRAGLPQRVKAIPGFLPKVSAAAVFAMDIGTSLPLLTRDADRLLPPASLVKLMTAIVVMSELNRSDGKLPTEKDTISQQEAVDVFSMNSQVAIIDRDMWSGTSAKYQPGDIVTIEDLLFGLALASGNDAGRALARVFGKAMLAREGSANSDIREAHQRFVKQMNLHATKIGLSNGALFTTPLGGNDSRLSARDIAKMAVYAFVNWPKLEEVFGKAQHVAQVNGPMARRHTIAHTCLLQARPMRPLAAKTGTMAKAGACLMTWWAIQEAPDSIRRVVIVTLGGGSKLGRFSDHVTLYTRVLADWYSSGRLLQIGQFSG